MAIEGHYLKLNTSPEASQGYSENHQEHLNTEISVFISYLIRPLQIFPIPIQKHEKSTEIMLNRSLQF